MAAIVRHISQVSESIVGKLLRVTTKDTSMKHTSKDAPHVKPKPSGGTGESTPAEADFDPRSLTLSQNFVAMVGVKKETMRVAISKPPPQLFFATHADPSWRIQIAALELKEDRETFVVAPGLVEELSGEWAPKVLVPCQTRQGGFYLWPIRLPGTDGRIDSWNESAHQIVADFAGQWIRLHSNREAGAYDVVTPVSPFPPPVWPESAEGLLKKAFRDRVIESLDHPVVKRLRGL